ncbi:MAG: hypothetical protein NT023_01070, partial [Armatimonadetes bacterium]|nr:hypothetical protein [Armatimonadota bacterium]
AFAVLIAGLIGCGSGGGSNNGGGGGDATLHGKILLVSTSAQPAPSTFVEIGGVQGQASDSDGQFNLTAIPATATVLTIRNVNGSGTEQLRRTLTVQLTSGQTTDLGAIYLSDQGYTANIGGRVVTQVNSVSQAVAGAKITVSGVKATSNVNGTFSMTGLPVGLGSLPGALLGDVRAAGFIISAPVGSTPLPPFAVTGKVTVQGVAQAGITVNLKAGVTNLGSITSDSGGNYFFWVVPDTYTITASKSGFASKQVTVKLNRTDTPVTASSIDLTP